MKKLFLIVLCSVFLYSIFSKPQQVEKEELRGVFISYIELSQLKGKEEKEAKKDINQMIDNIKNLKLNTIILQVRSATDAIYFSDIYPFSSYISKEEGQRTFDMLDYFLTKAHEKNISLIAWINPYRIRTTEDISSITKYSPAYSYLDTDTIFIKNGIFWNPSKEKVKELIVEGVKEVLSYPIDGILFDDYFYPDDEIDQKDYEEYAKENPNITKKEYHLQVINEMVKEVHELCKKKNIPFGISPDGNMENNYEKHYADIKTWLNSSEYIDFLMPQIYYGFYNSTKAYVKVIKEWDELFQNNEIPFYIALAFYKVGKEDIYAKAGQREWLENDNIIMREVILSRNLDHYQGFSLFRYDNVFNQNSYTDKSRFELENLKKVIK